MATFETFFDSPTLRSKRRVTQRFPPLKPQELSPLLKLKEKGKFFPNIKSKPQTKTSTTSLSVPKRPFVRFDLGFSYNYTKKSLFPNPFSEDAENLSVSDEGIAFEAYFGRKKDSKYLVPAEMALPQSNPEENALKTSRSMYDLAVRHLLDDSGLSDDADDKQINTATSLEGFQNNDIDAPLIRRSLSGLKLWRQGSTTQFNETSFEKASRQERNTLLERNQAKITSLEKIAQEERLPRRKSCTCRDCGVNKKLVKSSTLFLVSDLHARRNSQTAPEDSSSTSRGEAKPRTYWMNLKGNGNHQKFRGQANGKVTGSGNGSTSPFQNSRAAFTLKRFANKPFAPLMLRRHNSKHLHNEITKESTRQSFTTEPSPASQVRDVFFSTKIEPEGEDVPMKMIKLLGTSFSAPVDSNTRANDVALSRENSSVTGIAEHHNESLDSSAFEVKNRASGGLKNTMLSKFSLIQTNQPSPGFRKKESDSYLTLNLDEVNNTSPKPLNRNSNKIQQLAENLAKIVQSPLLSNRPVIKSLAFTDRVKKSRPDDTEIVLPETERSQKSINRSVREILERNGKHPGLLAAMVKKEKKKPRKHFASTGKEDLSLPYMK